MRFVAAISVFVVRFGFGVEGMGNRLRLENKSIEYYKRFLWLLEGEFMGCVFEARKNKHYVRFKMWKLKVMFLMIKIEGNLWFG